MPFDSERRWRQADLAQVARVGRSVVARIERGLGDTVPLRKLEAIANALGARILLRLDWHGEALDRMLDSAHARLVEIVAGRLRSAGWEIVAEATFLIRGERGSIDLLAWHPGTRILLVVEVKSVVPDIQSMLASLDRKMRLAWEIAAQRGWEPVAIGKLLVIGDTRTSRRRVQALAATFDATFPHRAPSARRWIADPQASTPLRGMIFLSPGQGITTRHRAPARRSPPAA